MPLWPKTPPSEVVFANNATVVEILMEGAKKAKKKDLQKMCYELFNLSGHSSISIIDMQTLCSNFPEDSPLGKEALLLLNEYTQRNLRAYRRKMYEFDLHNYAKVINDPCLSKDLDQIFCKQFVVGVSLYGNYHIPGGFGQDPKLRKAEPIARMTSVPDESDKPQSYFDEMTKLKSVYALDNIYDEFKPNTALL